MGGGAFQPVNSGEYLNLSNLTNNAPTLTRCTLQRTGNDGVYIWIAYQNVRGLRTKIDELFLAASDCNYDLIVLTETGLNDSINDLQLFGNTFNVYRCDRNSRNSCKSRFGGVLVAVARRYVSHSIHTNNGQGLEQICVSASVKGKNLFVCGVYIPPDRSTDTATINDHIASVDELRAKATLGDSLLVCGDYNQPHMQWAKGDGGVSCINADQLPFSSSALLDGMDFLNLGQASVVRNGLNRTLDLVFCSFDQEINVNECCSPLLPIDSHHPALSISLQAIVECNESDNGFAELTLNYRKTNFDALTNHLLMINWESMFADVDVHTQAEMFCNEIRTWLSINVPQKRLPSKPVWSTPLLRDLKRKRNACQRRLRHQRSPDNKWCFQQASNAYRRLNAALYRSHVLRIQSGLRTNPKSFWNFVNSKRSSKKIPTNVFLDDSSAISISDSCDLFARHFASVFNVDRASQQEAESAVLNVPVDLIDVRTFEVTTGMVTDAGKKLKCSYSPGPDGIPAAVLCRCIEAIAVPLCFIFNQSLQQGSFPSTWKKSLMFPVFKSGDRRNVKNYRGITNLSAVSKLFEIIVSNYILERMKNYISFDQHGFMPGRSVTTNLLQFTSTCITSLERKAQVDVIYTDLKAAFDKIDHQILLSKLSRLGVSENLLSWLKSYLLNRELRVMIESHTSRPFSNTSGIPQGSNLGPLLFILYFNDASLLLGNGFKLVYADDLKLYLMISSIEDCERLQVLLDKFVCWCRSNKLMLSINKCVVMTFHRSNAPIEFGYKIDDVTLSRVSKVNDLGVTLDSKLSFDQHRSEIISKASRQLGFIAKIANDFSDPHCWKALYCALVRPILETASIVWCPHQISWNIRIERIQKRFLRLALRDLPWGNPSDLPPYPDRCRLLGLDTLQRRRKIQQAVFIGKLLNGEIDSPWLLSAIDLRAPQRTLRNDALLVPRFHRTSFGFNEPLSACIRAFSLIEHLFEFNEPGHRLMNKVTRSNVI